MKYDLELDTRGLYCPLPIIKTKIEMETLEKGGILKVIADDPGAKTDFPAWCRETGNILEH